MTWLTDYLARLVKRSDDLCQQMEASIKEQDEAEENCHSKQEKWDGLTYQFYKEQDKIKPPFGNWNEEKRKAHMKNRYPGEWRELKDAEATLNIIENQINRVAQEIKALERTIRILQIAASAGELSEDIFSLTSTED